MGWESHHSRSTHPRHLGQHSANLSPATPMCLLSSPDSDLFLSAQGAGFNRPYTLNNYFSFSSSEEKKQFLELVRSNPEMGNDYIESDLLSPTTEEIKDARPLAMVLPQDVLNHAALITATLCRG